VDANDELVEWMFLPVWNSAVDLCFTSLHTYSIPSPARFTVKLFGKYDEDVAVG